MSNSAYLIPKKMPPFPQLDALVTGIVVNRFSQFKIETIDKSGWFISHPDPTHGMYYGLNIWLDEYVTSRSRKQAIQIKHGHSGNFMWWIEYEVRERLAVALNAKQVDDGVGAVKNETTYYQTYVDYVRAVYDGKMIGFQIDMIKQEMTVMPPDLVAMVGDLG